MSLSQMPRKHHKPEEIVAKLRQVDVLTSQGKSVADAIRAIGVTEATHYRWRPGSSCPGSDQRPRAEDGCSPSPVGRLTLGTFEIGEGLLAMRSTVLIQMGKDPRTNDRTILKS
jgi:hypothetical protein